MYQHILITVPKARRQSNVERLQQMYALTPGEAAVALLVACGRTLHECASIRGVSLTTVRTHLQSIYGKTDTHRQSELVALLLAGPAQLEVECIEDAGEVRGSSDRRDAWGDAARP